MSDVLVTPLDLAEMLLGTPPVVLDVRWQLGDFDGREAYRDGHIPGAVYADLDTELAAPPSGAVGGRHPIPAIEDLQAAARSWGITDGVPVVVYDDSGNLAAARAWWLLRWAGLADVRLLDGGLAAWTAEGLRTTTGDGGRPRAGKVTLTGGNLPLATIDDVASGTARGSLRRQRGDGEFLRASATQRPRPPALGHP